MKIFQTPRRDSITLLYHYFHPDDVVSAKLFSDIAEDMAKRGDKVTVITSNRFCHHPDKAVTPYRETYKGCEIIRCYRPGLDQTNTYLRLINVLWMFAGWLWKVFTLPPAEIYLIGSDPQFSQLLFPLIKWIRPKSRIVFWCHDLFPEAAIADREKVLLVFLAKTLKRMIKPCYKYADLVVDIGPCMRKRLDAYETNPAARKTVTPWALVEPDAVPDFESGKSRIYGQAELVLLYSGNMGKAHDFELFIELARKTATINPRILFAFGCRGKRFGELKAALKAGDVNITLLPFAEESELKERLSASDIHMVSLREKWAGVVVPSKFFGSLAVGRPALYTGPADSTIAKLIRKHNLGWILTRDNLSEIAGKLVDLAKNKAGLSAWQQNAFDAYQNHFSKRIMLDAWADLLARPAEKPIPAPRPLPIPVLVPAGPKLRVLHVFKTYLPDSFGGVEQVIYQLASSTTRMGVDNTVLCISKGQESTIDYTPEARVVRCPTHFEKASTPISFTIFHEYSRCIKEADVVHYHFPYPVQDLLHLMYGGKKPSLVTYHSDIIRQKNLKKLYKPLMQRFLAAVDVIVATSENYFHTSDVLKRYEHKVRVIPLGIDEDCYPQVDEANRQSWRERVGEGFFLFIGVLRYYKGLTYLLKAVKDRPNHRIVIAGGGPMEAELKAEAQALGLSNIEFVGWISELDKVSLLSLCSAVVFPSHLRAEAFGVTLLEGAMFGKALLSTEIGTGTSYVNLHNVTGLTTPPADPDAIRAALDRFAADPEQTKQFGVNAQERYRRLFTAESMTRDYYAIYTELAARGAKGERPTAVDAA